MQKANRRDSAWDADARGGGDEVRRRAGFMGVGTRKSAASSGVARVGAGGMADMVLGLKLSLSERF